MPCSMQLNENPRRGEKCVLIMQICLSQLLLITGHENGRFKMKHKNVLIIQKNTTFMGNNIVGQSVSHTFVYSGELDSSPFSEVTVIG